jgi:UrcA family protein
MSRTDPVRRLASSTLVAIGLAIATGAVAAAQDIQEGTVSAPEVSSQRVGRDTIGAPIDIITVVSRVSREDLDLSKTADAAELKARVNAAAQAVCTALRRTVPFEGIDYVTCIKAARRSAKAHGAVIVASE